MAAALQYMNAAPRAGKDPRIAKMEVTKRDEINGILYNFVDKSDYGRYKILSDEELELEARRSQEMAATILSLNSKKKKFGSTTIYSTQKTNKNHSSNGTTNMHPNLNINSNRPRTAAQVEEEQVDEMSAHGLPPPNYKTSGKFTAEEKMVKSLTEMQIKYQKNLEVIDKLFAEKQSMESRLKKMELSAKRNPTSKKSTPIDRFSNRQEENDDVLLDTLHAKHSAKPDNIDTNFNLLDGAAAGGDECLPDTESTPYPASSHSPPPPSYSNKRLSAREASSIFDDPDDSNQGGRMSRPISRQGGVGGSISSKRSSSVGGTSRRSSTTPTISLTMQADIDKRLQKKREIEDRKREELLKESVSEEERRKRLLLASTTGGEFTAMTERYRKSQEAKQKKIDELKKKEEEANKLKEEESSRKKKQNQLLAQSLSKTDKTWQQLLEEEKVERQRRIEKRKEELSKSASYPSGFSSSVEAWAKKVNTEEPKPTVPVFKAKDPEEIAKKHELQNERLKAKQEKGEQKLPPDPSKVFVPKEVESMLARQEQFEKKRKEAAEAKKLKEQKEEEDRKAEEKRKREKLLEIKIPSNSQLMTKTAVNRAKKIQDELERKKVEEEEERKRQLKSQKSMRETAAMTSIEIAEWEAKRKAEHGGFFELSKTEEIAAERAQRQREEGVATQKALKAKLRAVVNARPSLISRQTQAVEKEAAGLAALQKVANAINGRSTNAGGGEGGDSEDEKYDDDNEHDEDDDDDSPSNKHTKKELGKSKGASGSASSSSWKSKANGEEFFTEEEKIRIGVMKS